MVTSTPIRASLTGSDCCSALGITKLGHVPVLGLCRALIAAGHDPTRPLHAYRGDVLALAVRSIAKGSRLTIEDDRHGRPRLRLWRDRGCGARLPAAQTGKRQQLVSQTIPDDG